MHINKKVIVLLIVIFSLTLIVFFGYKRTSRSYDKEMPSDFNFFAKVEYDTYLLDTYNNTLTKKFDWEHDTIISFEIGQEFKEKIYNTLCDIDIYKYPENYAPTSTITVDPSTSYFLKFTFNSDTTEINWTEHTYSEKKEAKKLREIFETIYEYLEQDDRVKSLPEDRRAFL